MNFLSTIMSCSQHFGAVSRCSVSIFSRFADHRQLIYFSASCHGNFCGEREIPVKSKYAEGTESRVPVLIVGAGPVGLSLSILLSKYGIRSMVVEQRSELSQHPQAHFLNNRTMEILRKMEGLAKDIESKQPPLDQWRRFVYCNTLAGPVLGTIDHVHPHDILERKSPTSVAHLSQHRLLPLLLERAHNLNLSLHHGNNIRSDGKLGNILLEHKLISVQTNPNSVLTTIHSSVAGVNERKSLECSYLVGTDGAGSSVRRLMGVRMQGEAEMQNLISVHFMSKDLGRYLLANQPGMLYFVFNTGVIAVIVAHDLQLGEFIAQIPFYPPQQRFEDFTKDVCRELICEVAGIQNLAVEVITIKQWVMHAEVAEAFICGHGRVILAGDAAHRFPPAGGFGMNTGIQDVHNLAWKLAAVLNGLMSPDSLMTYETERRPVAKANTALSVANFKAAMAIPIALGLDPSVASVAQKIISSAVPSGLQSAVFGAVLTVGRFQVSPLVLNRFNPLGSSRIAQVEQILQHGHSLQLQFPAEDLGFTYLRGALVSDNPYPDELEYRENLGRRREYVPSNRPGGRLPHCCISYLGQDDQISSKSIFSTLDLISSDRVHFLLIVGPRKSGCQWGDAAIQAARLYKIPVKVAVLWPEGSAKRLWMSSQSAQDHPSGLTEEESYVLYEWGYQNRDHVVQYEDFHDSWWELCKESLSGATLVRPDDHVAWHVTWEADNRAVSELERVFNCVLRPEDQSIFQ